MNPDEKAAKLERHLLKTKFPLECQELPMEALTEEELEVVNKCIAQEELNDDEFSFLKKTLQKHRENITKYRPTETVEAVKDTVQIIKTEKELLDILDDESNKILRVHLTYQNQVYELDFEILPVDDSRIVDYMQLNIDLFKDYSDEEKSVFIKSQNNKPLSKEEQAMVDKISSEINAIAGQERAKLIDGFLASQLRLPESSQSFEDRKLFWKKFPFMEKWAIVQQVEERLGLTEKSNEKLFPAM